MSALRQFAGLRILFLNWRDLSNPASGGAEVYAEQIARRFARAGALVTLFTSRYPDAPPYDWTNDYLIVREGGRFGVYLAAARHLKRHARRYDAVVDFQNGIPFFAPLWASADMAVVCVVHHVHQAQFDMYFRWPLNRIARLLESKVSRHVYRHYPLVAVSPSTRAGMRHQLGLRGPIHIVPNGIDPLQPTCLPRSPTPTIAVVTRLAPHKRLHHLVNAVPDLLHRWPDLRVDIAGTGPARDALAARIQALDLECAVTLHGRVSEQAKSDLLSQAWLTVAPSLAEGWGLTVMEANTVGTPAVAYDVPGLRDSVRDKITGWLVPPGPGLATALINALDELADPDRQNLIADQSRQWARRFSWESSAERLAAVLLSEIAHREQGSLGRRKPVDLATVAWWSSSDVGEVGQLLRKTLRATDVISSDENGLRVLLTGCDEVGAAKALQRVPVPPSGLWLATNTQVLCGTGDDNLA